ncbi:TonB-dependent receptor [Winogradskyella eckloniae]|uniref:TonB-dependent receptor n=1 Tax=Winogradskyella eckloniae TaxID=1089306 RepID=UPI0015633112|nr:TonB-dependent receptor [Winogradskyella eckloniae]NRD20757.1 TonB-dependent receptor [Winogradskyella eckloniae]
MKIKFLIFILTISSSLSFVVAQEKDTIADQTVNVIKPYQPTISDAFKIKDNPKLIDSNAVKKKDIKYNIFSIPVASTFTPAKGKAATVDKVKAVKLYDNYASLGVGTYTTILGEVYLNHELSRDENVGGYFSHHSSQGGIDDLLLDDNFSKTKLNAHYAKNLREFSWKVDGGFDMQTYNWYGLPQEFFGQAEADFIDSKHTFTSFNIGGKINFDDAIVKDASLRFRRFGDDRGSGENLFNANTNFEVSIRDADIEAEVFLDGISGSFDTNYEDTSELNYGNFMIGLAPSYQLNKDDLTINLGVRLTFFNDTELSKSKFYIHPNIDASYRLVDELLIAYGGLTGSVIQNSYYSFANTNPFVSPTLGVAPTNQQFSAFVGVKGKLTNNLSYNVRGNYGSEKGKALFKSNGAPDIPTEDYHFGNSFNVVYDNITTFSISGELNVDVNRNFSLGIKGQYFAYDTKDQPQAWNLPDLEASLFVDYQITEQWFAGASGYYVGERKDERIVNMLFAQPSVTRVSLDSYFDLNAHVGYKINEQLSVFAKANNIFNQDYERWLDYPVQGIQLLAGATYQFDF